MAITLRDKQEKYPRVTIAPFRIKEQQLIYRHKVCRAKTEES